MTVGSGRTLLNVDIVGAICPARVATRGVFITNAGAARLVIFRLDRAGESDALSRLANKGRGAAR